MNTMQKSQDLETICMNKKKWNQQKSPVAIKKMWPLFVYFLTQMIKYVTFRM